MQSPSTASDEVVHNLKAQAKTTDGPPIGKNSISNHPSTPMRSVLRNTAHAELASAPPPSHEQSDHETAEAKGEEATDSVLRSYKRIALFFNMTPTPLESNALNAKGITPITYKLSNICRKPSSLLNTIRSDIRSGRVRWVHGVIDGNRGFDHGWIAQICRSAHRAGSPWSLSILGNIKQGDAVDKLRGLRYVLEIEASDKCKYSWLTSDAVKVTNLSQSNIIDQIKGTRP